MDLAFALILAAAVVGAIVWRVTRKKPVGGSGSSGGGGRPGADHH